MSIEKLRLARIPAVRRFLPHLINFWNGVKTGFTPSQILVGLAQALQEELRFGGASGAWVNRREIGLALGLLPTAGRVLDLGCGTGQLTRRSHYDSFFTPAELPT